MSLARPWALAASISLPLGLPLLAFTALFTEHLVGYHGTCGPYAIDIEAYPCSRDEYLANFFGGFDGLGLMLVLFVAFLAGVGIVVLGWASAWIAGALRPRSTRPD